MQDYDIKRGHWKNVDGDNLKKLATEIFGKSKIKAGRVFVSYKALDEFSVKMVSKSVLSVDTKMKTDVSEGDAADTVARYNDFLLRATGFTSKQRRQRINQKAKKGTL